MPYDGLFAAAVRHRLNDVLADARHSTKFINRRRTPLSSTVGAPAGATACF